MALIAENIETQIFIVYACFQYLTSVEINENLKLYSNMKLLIWVYLYPISSTFYEQLLLQDSCPQKLQSQIVNREKLPKILV